LRALVDVLADVLEPAGLLADPQSLLRLRNLLARQRCLLLLDSCEKAVLACAEVVQSLLEACPGLAVLATSQEPLGVPGESLFRLQPMRYPEHTSVGEIDQFGAVKLFLDRARLIDPEFGVNRLAEPVTEICRRLDGIPLAIELAAARLGEFTVDQIADNLRAV